MSEEKIRRLLEQYHSDTEIKAHLDAKLKLMDSSLLFGILTSDGIKTHYSPEVQAVFDKIDRLIKGIQESRYKELFYRTD